MINTALTLGYNVETGTKYGGSAIDEYIATQILIWLIAHEQFGTGYEDQIVNEFTVNSPAAKPIFYQLRENVVNYHTIPSFAADDPGAVGAYEITALEDVVTPDGTVHLKAGELASMTTHRRRTPQTISIIPRTSTTISNCWNRRIFSNHNNTL